MALHPLKTEGMWIGRRRNDTTAWHPAMYDDTSTRGGAHAADSTPPGGGEGTRELLQHITRLGGNSFLL